MKNIGYMALFSIFLFGQPKSYDNVDMVLSDADGNLHRIKFNEAVVVNDDLMIFRGIDYDANEILFFDERNEKATSLRFNEIKSLQYSVSTSKVLKYGVSIGIFTYAWWGFAQAEGEWHIRNAQEDNNSKGLTNVWFFTLGASILGGGLGGLVSYPLQILYNSYKPSWSTKLVFVGENKWRIL